MGGPLYIDDEKHEETDNFQKCSFKIDEVEYFSTENYYQCAKATNIEDREKIRFSGVGLSCWVLGAKIKKKKDWEMIKIEEMYKGNKAKFEQNPDLAEKLISSNGKINKGNSSDFWNIWNAKILTRIRAELRKTEEDLKVIDEIKFDMECYVNEKKKKKKK